MNCDAFRGSQGYKLRQECEENTAECIRAAMDIVKLIDGLYQRERNFAASWVRLFHEIPQLAEFMSHNNSSRTIAAIAPSSSSMFASLSCSQNRHILGSRILKQVQHANPRSRSPLRKRASQIAAAKFSRSCALKRKVICRKLEIARRLAREVSIQMEVGFRSEIKGRHHILVESGTI